MTVVPIVIGPLGAVSDMFEKYMGKLDVTIRLKVIEKTALLGTAGLDWTSCGPTYIQSFFTIFGQCINVLNYKISYHYSIS